MKLTYLKIKLKAINSVKSCPKYGIGPIITINIKCSIKLHLPEFFAQ
jgi:hypothetical protein